VPNTGTEPIGVRFFTRLDELSGCGHGTIAVHAYLASAGRTPVERSRLLIGGRTVEVTGTPVGDEIEAWVDDAVPPPRPPRRASRPTYRQPSP
jgi:trans-2,3-dihydro-3-hydroxyanthranilate isomerase